MVWGKVLVSFCCLVAFQATDAEAGIFFRRNRRAPQAIQRPGVPQNRNQAFNRPRPQPNALRPQPAAPRQQALAPVQPQLITPAPAANFIPRNATPRTEQVPQLAGGFHDANTGNPPPVPQADDRVGPLVRPIAPGPEQTLPRQYQALEAVLNRPSQAAPSDEYIGKWVGRCIRQVNDFTGPGGPRYSLTDTLNDELSLALSVGAPAVQAQGVEVLPVGKVLAFSNIRDPKYDPQKRQFLSQNRFALDGTFDFHRNYLLGKPVLAQEKKVRIEVVTNLSHQLGFFRSLDKPRLVYRETSLQSFDTVPGSPRAESFRRNAQGSMCVYMPLKEAEELAARGKGLTLENLTKIDN